MANRSMTVTAHTFATDFSEVMRNSDNVPMHKLRSQQQQKERKKHIAIVNQISCVLQQSELKRGGRGNKEIVYSTTCCWAIRSLMRMAENWSVNAENEVEEASRRLD